MVEYPAVLCDVIFFRCGSLCAGRPAGLQVGFHGGGIDCSCQC